MTNHDYSRARRYNKLVRDRIPEIIAATGNPHRTHIASDAEYRDQLRSKLLEEVQEYLAAGKTAELADILEVLYALAALDGVDQPELERLRQAKVAERGAFSKQIILEES